jgi:hypothetical protein
MLFRACAHCQEQSDRTLECQYIIDLGSGGCCDTEHRTLNGDIGTSDLHAFSAHWSRSVSTNGCSMVARMPRYGPALPGIVSEAQIRATGQNGSSWHVLALLNSSSRQINKQSSGLLICGCNDAGYPMPVTRRYRRGLLSSTAPKNPVPWRASGNAEVVSTTSTPPPVPRSLLLCAPLRTPTGAALGHNFGGR